MHTLASQGRPLTSVERTAIVEEFWASRNAWADSMNADRRQSWERKWAGIGERDLAPSHTRQVKAIADTEESPSRILLMRRKTEEGAEDSEPAKLPGYRFYWQPKSLQIPMP